MQKGYRNESYPVMMCGGQMVNLILYKREPGMLERIKRTNAVSDFLNGLGLPVRHTIDQRIIRLSTGKNNKYGALYAYLPGRTIPWDGYTQQHLKAIGAMLGNVHANLQDFPKSSQLPSVAVEYCRIFQRLLHYFSDPLVQEAMHAKLTIRLDLVVVRDMLELLRATQALSGQQALHMDFVRGNILFVGDASAEISGILDFEKTAYGHPLFDIARTLAFLLVDCKYKSPEKVRKYFLESGYRKHGGAAIWMVSVKRLNGRTLLLDELINLFLLYDFYKFLRHNPYESLPMNEHYVRTRGMLLERKVIQTDLRYQTVETII